MQLKCLICALNPIARSDFDGLCWSCRASVAQGLFRVEWIGPPDRQYRVVTVATVNENPLGTEYPNHLDPILYEPQKLPRLWAELDRARDEEARAETVLAGVTRLG